jgi:L-threonylcarbamoyladenylate synthase
MTEPRIVSIAGVSLSSQEPTIDEVLTEALSVLRSGQLLVIPTNSSYVIAVDADNSSPQREVRRLRQVQESFTPTIIVGDFDSLSKVCLTDELSDEARELLHTGELSIVLPTLVGNEFGEDGADAVVVNMPSIALVRTLLQNFGLCYITAAGIAGSGPTIDIQNAVKEFGIFVDLYWDLGLLNGKNTTVIDFRSSTPVVVRRGNISRESLLTAFPNLELVEVDAN